MVGTDPIADMFTRIRNALGIQRTSTQMPYSKMKLAVANILKDNGYLSDVAVEGEGIDKILVLSFDESKGAHHIHEIKKVSKPGRRLYAGYGDIPYVKNGRGMVIVSSSRGLITDRQARKMKIGGELIGMVF